MQRLLSTLRRMLVMVGVMVLALVMLAGFWLLPVDAASLLQDDEPVMLRLAMPPLGKLDPVQISRFEPNTRDIVENIFVGLTRFNPTTQEIEPMLAESWTVSDDGLTWTFTLRDDVQWVHYDPEVDAVTAIRPVVAGDFVYAIQRACDPLRPSPITANLMVIQGCETIANAFPEVINDIFVAREIGVRATGPNTLEIDLLFPTAYFLSLTSMPEFRPLARATEGNANGLEADISSTNGPFTIQEQTADGLTLVRNPFWPDNYAGNVDQVDITFTSESQTPVQLAARDQIDLARLDHTDLDTARAQTPELLHSAPGETVTMLGFSYDRTMVDNVAVRRALSLSIDREALVNQLFADGAIAATQFTPTGMVAEPALDASLFDPSAAQAALAEAEFANCQGIPEKLLVLVPDDDPVWEQLGQLLIEQWSANLGCNAALFEVRTLPRTLMIELSHATYDTEKVTRSHIWLANWSADYIDANAWVYDALHCRYGYIRGGRECGRVDTLLDQAAAEMDNTARQTLYSEAENLFFGLGGSFPVTPLYVAASTWLQQPWLSDVNAFGPARFDLWVIDRDQKAGL